MCYQKQMPYIFVKKRTVSKIKNPSCRGSTRIKYITFSKYSRHLHKLVQAGARTTMTYYQYWYVKMSDMTFNAPYWFYSVFSVFSYMVDDHPCLNLKDCIITKLSRIVFLINIHTSTCWYDRCNYKLRKVLWFNLVLWRFQCLIRYSSSIFH